jgi:hypothetical protein
MAVAAVLAVTLIVGIAVAVWKRLRRNAEQSGYDSVGEYLRAVPVSDREKRESVDLALIGLVLCLVGRLFPPLLLVGLFPLFYGSRKLMYTHMGLGLIDDADEGPSAG